MPIRQRFLGWDKSLIRLVLARLTSAWNGGPLDLREYLLIVPTRQSGRRLKEALAEWAAKRGTGVLPAEIITPDRLLRKRANDALVPSHAEELFRWIRVLRSANLRRLDSLFPRPPGDAGHPGWALDLGRRFTALRRQLAENGLSIAACTEHPEAIGEELMRWQQLAELEQQYLAELSNDGRKDALEAMSEAAAAPELPSGIKRMLLLGVPDPIPLTLKAISNISKSIDVEICIHAPEELAPQFDEFGRPNPEYWGKSEIPIPGKNPVRLTADPNDQARQMLSAIGELETRRAGKDFAIAILRDELIPPVEELFAELEIPSYHPGGEPLAETAPCRVLADIGAWLRDDDFANFANLCRNADLLSWLKTIIPEFDPVRLLTEIDSLQNEHILDSTDALRKALSRQNGKPEITALTVNAIDKLTTGIKLEDETAPLVPVLRRILSDIYQQYQTEPGNPEHEKFLLGVQALNRILAKVDEAERIAIPTADRLDILSRLVEKESIYPPHPAGAVELQGWLELPWEDAPQLIINGMNDGDVPESLVGDAFLPDQACRKLGLQDNLRRFARDAFLFKAMAESRKNGGITCIVGKTDDTGSPLRPSRLLFLCQDKQLAQRAGQLFAEVDSYHEPDVFPQAPPWRLKLPMANPPDHLSVTMFRDYLACPLRFYLKRCLKMQHLDDRKRELDALDFGNLCHYVLRDFGRDTNIRDNIEPEAIKDYLLKRADAHVYGRYGRELPLAIIIQFESMRQRLRKFAEIQAAERLAGWKIIEAEKDFVKEDNNSLAGYRLRGIIDRIEEHEDGRIRVLDYKTSDSAKTPAAAHIGNGNPERDQAISLFKLQGKDKRWIDLQLPLYIFMLQEKFPGRKISCGYFNLPKAVSDTGISVWDELDSQVQEKAINCATDIAQAIRAGKFGPPSKKLDYDDFTELFPGSNADPEEYLEAVPEAIP